MQTSVILPTWIDNLIYQRMGAKYCCSNSDITVIDWDKSDMRNYLGTYFPRSFAEAYCIFNEYFTKESLPWSEKKEISIFDFGCGTGGEIIGLILSLEHNFPNLKIVKIKGLDGNFNALRMLEFILDEMKDMFHFRVVFKESPLMIDDIYDMEVINSVLKNKYDIIMSFKAICEFVTKKQFDEKNPYQYLPGYFVKKLNQDGIVLLEDVTTYNNVSQQWLPKMMDGGIANSNCRVILKNEGYNQCFYISHSRKKNDKSKVAWRIIKN